jgi:hypothetical protein
VNGSYQGDVVHFANRNPFQLGGDKNSPSSQMTLQLHDSEPSRPQELGMVIADGTNWDPDGDGNAEMVIYNGSTWLEIVDLGTSL